MYKKEVNMGRNRSKLMMLPRQLLTYSFALMLALMLTGCPGGEPASKSAQPCETVGARCLIRPGVLGVCDVGERGASSSTTRRALTCVPQH